MVRRVSVVVLIVKESKNYLFPKEVKKMLLFLEEQNVLFQSCLSTLSAI